MDWGVVALIVMANAATSAMLVFAGLWYQQRRLLPAATGDEARSWQAAGSPEPPMDTELATQRRRRRPAARQAPVAGAGPQVARRRGLKELLASVDGAPGTITEDQRAGIKDLLGKAAPTNWMSSAQAHVVLCARDYAEAAIDRSRGTRSDFDGRDRIIRRLTLTIVADQRARSFVTDWAEGRYAGGDAAADRLEQDVWTWVQHRAARLAEADSRQVAAD